MPPWEPDEVGQMLSQGLTTGSGAAAAAADDDANADAAWWFTYYTHTYIHTDPK